MKVSVIIPFNSGEGYLKDCLDSLAAQSYRDFEVLLVPDGFDGDIEAITAPYRAEHEVAVYLPEYSGEIMETGYGIPYMGKGVEVHKATVNAAPLDIKIISLPEGAKGVAAARNAGLKAALGEYVYFLDADDYLFDEAIRVLVEAAEEDNSDMVYGKFHRTYFKRDIFMPVYVEKREKKIEKLNEKMLERLYGFGFDIDEAERDYWLDDEGVERDSDEDSNDSDFDDEDMPEVTENDGSQEEPQEEAEDESEEGEEDYSSGEQSANLQDGTGKPGDEAEGLSAEGAGAEAEEAEFIYSGELSERELAALTPGAREAYERQRAAVILEQQMLERRENAYRNAIRRNIYAKKRFRNVTVLHKLFRKSTLDELALTFDESLTYYSDFKFVAAFFNNRDLNVRKDYHSHYIKRKHGDPINSPALSQIQDPERFSEMLRLFNETLDLIDKHSDSQVEEAVEHQIMVYFTDYFIKKLRQSENDFWRNERFDEMRKLARRIPYYNLRKEMDYRRTMVRALRHGNMRRCRRLITVRLAAKKYRKLLKGKSFLEKYLYRHVYLKRPVEENLIVFESFLGKNYSDSPKYIYEYLAKNYPGKYKFVWVLDNATELPYGGEKVNRFGRKYMKYMATAKYFVFNMRQPTWFKKRKGTIFLETWHGTPLKKLVFDLEEVYSASPLYKKEVYKQSREWDYLIAANKFSTRCFTSCFMFDNPILEYGYPRNDILHSANRDELAAELRERLGIPKDKKTILYAPTWRDDEYYGKGQYKFELKLDLNTMREKLSDEYVVLLRTHYFIADAIDTTGLEGFAFNFSKYDDISELYLVSDIIITDYSSVFFDYSNLKRPMLFYTYDLEKYRDVLRGFYIDIEEELPGPLLFTTEEVVDAVLRIDDITKEYADKYSRFYDKYCGLEDGHAAENVAKRVFEL